MTTPIIIEAMNILGLALEGLHIPAVEASQLQAHRLQDPFIGEFIKSSFKFIFGYFDPSTLISN